MNILRLLFLGLFALVTVWLWVPQSAGTLSVSFLDVGQGDAIFIEGPTGIQLLVDAGPPDRSVLRELGGVMEVTDRTIDAVLETHPDQDHIGGISDVFERYVVSYFLEPKIPNNTKANQKVEKTVEGSDAKRIIARRGMRLILGGGAYADVLFPDRDVSKLETNTGSVILRVVYGDTSFLLSGDSPQAIEKFLVSVDGEKLQSTVLKVGHHGSKNSNAEVFVRTINPEYGVYSRGCNNRYGHPAHEVLALFKTLHIRTLDTCEEGKITFTSDGLKVSIVRN